MAALNRFETLDRDFFEAVERSGLDCRCVWPIAGVPPPRWGEAEALAELFPEQHIAIYELRASSREVA